jgi:hypothetical protein|tara:strand:+ start:63 stop:464 length:402 start_codon:yes stop_codon:yes gene_type:complete
MNYSLLVRIIHIKKIFFLMLIFFSAGVQCSPKKFFSNPSFDGYLYLDSVKNQKYQIKAFITFDIKSSSLISGSKFYSQLISYECGQNAPKIIEELLAEKPFGRGKKINNKQELKKVQILVSPAYPSLFKETCI